MLWDDDGVDADDEVVNDEDDGNWQDVDVGDDMDLLQ